jgi:hypothetical protein
MARRFSKGYKTYSDWRSKAKETPYKRRIERLHGLYPNATLSQLRGHPKDRERGLVVIKPKPLFKLFQRQLSQRQSSIRSTAFDVLSQVRRGNGSLSRISRLYHTTPQTVLRHTNAFKKEGNRWKAKRYDKIERHMKINEKGREVSIRVKDSRYASTIGKYHSAVKQFLETGDESYLKPFRNKRIKDSKGKWHRLDTNPDHIYDIHEERVDEEFYTIYG